MAFFSTLQRLDMAQRKTVLASFLGWTLDAFDYFLLVFVMPQIAREFKVTVKEVAFSLMVTLAFRPLGAFLFGRLADRYGRRPILMLDIVLFAVLEAASAFAPSLPVLIVVRALFGIAMGGEWGIGASLAMESIPAEARGAVSGLLQEGYAAGYLLGALAYWALFDRIGWRGMFLLGALPALLVLFIRRHVPESPTWQPETSASRPSFVAAMRGQGKRFIYMVAMMTAFNLFSHGSQDMYPTFLKEQLHFSTARVSTLTIVLNLGAIAGGLLFGMLSQRIGRRRAIAIAALLAIPAIPLWAFGSTPLLLGIGVFALQMMVQGAWGVVPVHLNELSPSSVRGTLPGLAYQGGNLLASFTAPLLAWLAHRCRNNDGDNYGLVMALFIGVVGVLLATVVWWGPEARGAAFLRAQSTAGES